jgi:hypothetical protein
MPQNPIAKSLRSPHLRAQRLPHRAEREEKEERQLKQNLKRETEE